ncbi:bifunctional diguanylate cyclase/phosphohydrolase [Litchfieldia alkalitelluris]|uniref:bifunctional diguanylate cyclase/phosphohydrolase n=1 Tax=Litchfieldia alkalitelluris TaxID=304268 RepID=UPI0009986FD6
MHKIDKRPETIYLIGVSLSGILLHLFLNPFHTPELSEWVLIFSLVGAVLLLNHYTIPLPPTGNSLSMDSTVYLACIFLFGLQLTLGILILHSIIFGCFQRKIAWWKHVFNFSIYSFMIITAYYLFILTGGTIGVINTTSLLPYILSLTGYFFINVFLIGGYFLLLYKNNFLSVLKGLTKETFATYLSTLILSLILSILMNTQNIFGLFLFIVIALLLSWEFNQHFSLFQAMTEKAQKDFLTGLNNHGYFKEILSLKIKESKETDSNLVIGLLDLDDFKKYNDLYGHINGDNLLKFFGSLLQTECSKENFIASRYGGEEFTIIMPNTTIDEGFRFLNTLRKKVNDSYFSGVENLPYGCLSFSAGIVPYSSEIYGSSELLSKADQAMYQAKTQGKNIVQVFDDQTEYMIQNNSLSIDVALEEADQQLKIFLSKDIYTYRHSKRVYKYALDFSNHLDLSEKDKKTLILGALIHDIGKLEIPRDILNKKEKLTQDEWEMVKKHVTFGKEIISTNKKLDLLIPLVELHHERYDGRGYPHGLKGDNIPKLARILCIIDSFDAMTTERPYQKTKSFCEGLQELRRCSGEQFDPEFVEPFINFIETNYSEKFIKKEPATNKDE